MASIRLRNGIYQAQIRKAGCPPVSKTFRTKREAEQWARQTESEMERGKWRDVRPAAEMTLGEALERYADEISINKKGGQAERQRMTKMHKTRLASMSLDQIRPADIAKYRDGLVKQGFAPASVLRDLALLSHVFTIARTEWALPVDNPVKDVRKPKVSNARDRRLEPADLERLLSACQEHRGGWLYDVVILAMETAMRRSEIASLRRSWINQSGHYLTLPDTKNGERRMVPLSPKAMQALERLASHSQSDRIIPCEAGAISHAFLRAVRRAGLYDYRFHDLRHEATSRLFEIGFNTMEAAAVTGHKSLAMLMRYTHLHATNLAKKLRAARPSGE
jgi:integrase